MRGVKRKDNRQPRATQVKKVNPVAVLQQQLNSCLQNRRSERAEHSFVDRVREAHAKAQIKVEFFNLLLNYSSL